MKKLSYVLAGLVFALSAGLVQAESSSTPQEKQEYIPWTWDDIDD
jgi:hypothetical protein